MKPPPDLPSPESLRPLLDRFRDLDLVVWGDLVADRFLVGSTTRVSREAPALVLRYETEETRPGAAGNAALNAAALGARVKIVGYVGDDAPAAALRRRLAERNVDTDSLVVRTDGPTPVKTRIMAGGQHTVRQQILRIDQDPAWGEAERPERALSVRLQEAFEGADAVLISDYGLGSVRPSLHATLSPRLHDAGLPVTLDSRSSMLSYPGITAATPNESEVEDALRIRLDGDRAALETAGRILLSRLSCPYVVITRGSCGMAVFERERRAVYLPIFGTDQIADVTGAGDTVIAGLTLGLAAGAELLPAACLANIAAGLVVMKHGTAVVTREELVEALAGPS